MLGHLPENRTADLHGGFVELLFHAPGSGMTRAALHGVDGGLRNHRQHFASLLADVLDPQMAGDVIRDFAQRIGEIGLEEAVLVAGDQVLEGIEHRAANRLDIGVFREHQRQFLFEHQPA